jgi:hypothetical protein
VPATAREVAAALHDYDDDYLLCRRGNLGHVWQVVGYFNGASGVVLRRVECPRCGTVRLDTWETRGGRVGSSYRYGEGYRLEGVQPDTAAVRVEVMRRATVYADESAMLAALSNGGGRRR